MDPLQRQHLEHDTSLPNHYSAQGPVIVAYRDKTGIQDQLMCIHRGS
ncbi:hypothetical protein ACFYO5_11135 [Streptomyces sp. NPDC006259]